MLNMIEAKPVRTEFQDITHITEIYCCMKNKEDTTYTSYGFPFLRCDCHRLRHGCIKLPQLPQYVPEKLVKLASKDIHYFK